jgi:hypothetical protein
LICEDCGKLITEKYEEIKNGTLANLDLTEEHVNYLKDIDPKYKDFGYIKKYSGR